MRLRQHEDGHRALAEEAAGEVRRTLAQTRSAADCATLRMQMNSRGQVLLDELRRKQADYDRRTEHGRTQGVWLPSS